MLDIIQFIKQIFALWIFFLLMVAGVVIDLFGQLFTFLWRFISWKTDSFFIRKTDPFAAHQSSLQSKNALCTYRALQP